MAGFISEYLSDALLDHVWGDDTYTAPGTLWVALFTTAPTAGGGGTEVAGGSYGRVEVTNNLTNFSAASGQTKRNAAAFTFAAPTADWAPAGTPAVGAGWYDDETAGNFLAYGPFSTPRVIMDGDSAPAIVINGMTITLE